MPQTVAEALPALADTGWRAAKARARHAVIRPVLQHEPGSPDYGRAIDAAASSAGCSTRTVRRWLADYERDGWAGLLPASRPNRGRRTVHISRRWDRSVPFDDETKARIADRLHRDIRSLFAANLAAGWRVLERFARDTLIEKTIAAGFDPGKRALNDICKLPRNVVERGRPYRAVAIHDKDHKRWLDEHLSRVSRHREGIGPMDVVIADVHPVDVLLRRPDAGVYTARMISFHDVATNRAFIYIVFPPKGQGVRQEHVIAALRAMIADKRWGVPATLYLDNGGEFNALRLIDDALKLNIRARLLDDEPAFAASVRGRRSAIVKAQPYNAPAKGLAEGFYGLFERGLLSLLSGWIAGDRMRQKTANVGKAPEPYPFDEDQFLEIVGKLVEFYETHPQNGFLAGRSPRQAFAACAEAGWKRTDMDLDVFDAVFADEVTRRIRNGQFSLHGTAYDAEPLWRLPAGTAVRVRVPIAPKSDERAVCDEYGRYLCMATPKAQAAFLGAAGAREATRRRRAAKAGVAARRCDTDPVDMEARIEALASKQEPAPIPERGALIGMGETLEKIAAASRVPTADRRSIEAAGAAAEDRRRQTTRQAQDDLAVGPTSRIAAPAGSGGMSDDQRQAIDALLQRRRARG